MIGSPKRSQAMLGTITTGSENHMHAYKEKPCNYFVIVNMASGEDHWGRHPRMAMSCNMAAILQLIGLPMHADFVNSVQL